jgi:light-regulated signal transduction histidine kinase (bacteriophytochrome)
MEEIHRLNADLERRVEARTAELQKTNEQLARSNEDLTRFAYVASHDLQEPLRMIGSYAGLLAKRYHGRLDERADDYINYVVDGAKRMQTLVRDLLAYSRAGTQELKRTRVPLLSVLDDAKRNLEVAIAESRATVTHDELPTLDVDGGKLTQVFQNLLSNALKFRNPEEPPRIHIGASVDGPCWVITIHDNGIGFDQQFSDRIFLLFQRLHQVGTYPGTGIGLAICKRIIEAHGGRISAESTPGCGTTFRFTLPDSNQVTNRDTTEGVKQTSEIPENQNA